MGKPQFYPKVFDIDISVCMSCQICVEVCPFEAIKMDKEFELSQRERFDHLLLRKEQLSKSNGYYHKIHPVEAEPLIRISRTLQPPRRRRRKLQLKQRQRPRQRRQQPLQPLRRKLRQTAVAVTGFFLKIPDAEQHYGAGMFSRVYRRARDIQTSSFRNFFTRWV